MTHVESVTEPLLRHIHRMLQIDPTRSGETGQSGVPRQSPEIDWLGIHSIAKKALS